MSPGLHNESQASHNVIRLPPSPIRYCLSGFQDSLFPVYRCSLDLVSMTLMLVEINIWVTSVIKCHAWKLYIQFEVKEEKEVRFCGCGSSMRHELYAGLSVYRAKVSRYNELSTIVFDKGFVCSLTDLPACEIKGVCYHTLLLLSICIYIFSLLWYWT